MQVMSKKEIMSVTEGSISSLRNISPDLIRSYYSSSLSALSHLLAQLSQGHLGTALIKGQFNHWIESPH